MAQSCPSDAVHSVGETSSCFAPELHLSVHGRTHKCTAAAFFSALLQRVPAGTSMCDHLAKARVLIRTDKHIFAKSPEYVALRMQKLTQIAQLLLVLPLHQLDQSILIWLLASSGTASLTHAALRPMFRRRAASERSAAHSNNRRAAAQTQTNSRLAVEQLLQATPASSVAQRLDDALNATILHRHNEDLGAHCCNSCCVFCARGP